MTNPAKSISSCTEHLQRKSPMLSYALLHLLTTRPSNTSSLKMMDGKFLNLSSDIVPLILVANQRIYRNRFMIWKLSLLKTFPPSSKGQLTPTQISSSPNRMLPQIYSLRKSSHNSWPAKVFLLLLAPSTLTFLFSTPAQSLCSI